MSARFACSVALLLGVFMAVPLAASAQNKSAQHTRAAARRDAGKAHKADRAAARARASAERKVDAGQKPAQKGTEPTPPSERETSVPGSAGETADSAADAAPLDTADVRTEEGGTQVKVMEFSGLDIEGQLKTPQMLYFLNRLRAEFGRPRLPHRSFMPELQQGTQAKAMR